MVIILKNKLQFVTFPFFFMVELPNCLNAPRTYSGVLSSSCGDRRSEIAGNSTLDDSEPGVIL